MRTRIFLSLLLAAFVLAGCKPGVPSKYIQPGELEDILYDYCIAQGVTAGNSTPYDNKKTELYNYKKDILKKYGCTEAEFDSSMVYYMSNAKLLYGVYENISERLGNDAVAMGAAASDIDKFGSVDASGDTTDIWNERSTVVLTPFTPYNRLSFNIKADTTYKAGDRFMLDFDNKFIYQDGVRDGVVYLSVQYDNDSVVADHKHISSSTNYSLSIPSLKGHNIKYVRGFFYHTKKLEGSITTLKLMILNNIRLIRFHVDPEADSIRSLKKDAEVNEINSDDMSAF